MNEDPHKHLKEFHVLKLQGVSKEQMKLHTLPFLLSKKARDWLFYFTSQVHYYMDKHGEVLL